MKQLQKYSPQLTIHKLMSHCEEYYHPSSSSQSHQGYKEAKRQHRHLSASYLNLLIQLDNNQHNIQHCPDLQLGSLQFSACLQNKCKRIRDTYSYASVDYHALLYYRFLCEFRWVWERDCCYTHLMLCSALVISEPAPASSVDCPGTYVLSRFARWIQG